MLRVFACGLRLGLRLLGLYGRGIRRLVEGVADVPRGRLDGVVAHAGRLLLGRHLAVTAEVAELVALHALVREQVLRDALERVGVLGEDALSLGAGLVEDALDLLVDDGGGLLGIALRRAEIAADE